MTNEINFEDWYVQSLKPAARYDDLYAWIVILRNQPRRISRAIIADRKNNPRNVVKAAIMALRGA